MTKKQDKKFEVSAENALDLSKGVIPKVPGVPRGVLQKIQFKVQQPMLKNVFEKSQSKNKSYEVKLLQLIPETDPNYDQYKTFIKMLTPIQQRDFYFDQKDKYVALKHSKYKSLDTQDLKY